MAGRCCRSYRAHAVDGKARIIEGRESDFGDRRIGIARRKGLDNPSFPEIACLTITVERGVVEVGVEFGEDLGDENRFVRIDLVTVIRDRKGGGIASNIHFPGERPGGCVDDGDSAFRVVGHIEQSSVRRQRTAPWLGTNRDRRHDLAPALG